MKPHFNSAKKIKWLLKNPGNHTIHMQAFASGKYKLIGGTGFYKKSDVKNYKFKKDDYKKFIK